MIVLPSIRFFCQDKFVPHSTWGKEPFVIELSTGQANSWKLPMGPGWLMWQVGGAWEGVGKHTLGMVWRKHGGKGQQKDCRGRNT